MVEYDSGGKEPVRKLVTASKKRLLEKATSAFNISGSYEVDYMHPTLGFFIRPDNVEGIPDDCVQIRLVPVPERSTESPLSTASIVPVLAVQQSSTDASVDVDSFLNRPSVGPSTP